MKNIRSIVYVLAFLCMAGLLQAQETPLIANIDARQITNLDGSWHTIVDPYDVGYLDYHKQSMKDKSAFFSDYHPQNKSELVEYDFDRSPTLDVPGDWNTQRESLLLYDGTVWYKKTFDYPNLNQDRLFLHFGAAYYHADVYLDGEKLGEHDGGFTPFDFEITKSVKPKNNFLIVRVNDTRTKDRLPAITTDWWTYGGITRPVNLVQVPQTFIQDYVIQLQRGSMHTIQGWVQLNGPKLQQTITVQIPEAGLTKTFQTDAQGRANISFDANFELWSPENPKLYQVEISSDTDHVTDQIGFRSIETRGTQILLNGKPVFLRGVDIHEEAPGYARRAWTKDDDRTLLTWAKDLGCNFVRLAHYPHNEAMLRMADQMGIMVWGEIPVYWNIDWENPEVLKSAEQQLREMITRDHNRAALVIYSVANETVPGDTRNHFLRELIHEAHSLDATRLVSAALQAHESRQGDRFLITIEDPIAKDLDVVGNNEYIGWYVHSAEDADRTDWAMQYSKPLIMSEFGAGARFGYHGDAATRWSEEFQENVYIHQVAMLKRIPFLSGTAAWVLKDFRCPRRTLPEFQDYFNRKGLVTERGERKKAFFVLQKYYQELQSESAH